MHKQRPYDFDKLFPGQQPLKQTTVARQPKSKEGLGIRVNPLGETRNFNHPAKGSHKEVRVPTRSSRNTSGYTDRSKGSSAEKTSRKPSVGNIQLVVNREHPQDTAPSRMLPVSEVEQFFSGIGVRTVVKYVPMALHNQRKSVKRNLTNQILAVKLSAASTYPSKQLAGDYRQRVDTQPAVPAKPSTAHGITLTTSGVRPSLLQSSSRMLGHKNSCHSVASSVSSRYSSVHSIRGSNSNLRSVNERFRQSEQKINKLKEKLSQLYHLRSEASEKNLKIGAATKQEKPRLIRCDSLLLR